MNEQQFLEDCKKRNAGCRAFVTTEISKLGYDIIPSYTSFLIFPISMSGDAFMKGMYDEGVGIRVFNIADKPWCRVSMGTMEEMEYFVESFKKVTI
jgi:histidinol-phosphate aminotransferase